LPSIRQTELSPVLVYSNSFLTLIDVIYGGLVMIGEEPRITLFKVRCLQEGKESNDINFLVPGIQFN